MVEGFLYVAHDGDNCSSGDKAQGDRRVEEWDRQMSRQTPAGLGIDYTRLVVLGPLAWGPNIKMLMKIQGFNASNAHYKQIR